MNAPSPLREAYLDGLEVARQMFAEPALATRWAESSVLEEMSVGLLAGHLGGGILRVERFLAGPAPATAEITAAEYVGGLSGTADLQSELNRRVVAMAAEVAARGPEALCADIDAAVNGLLESVPAAPSDRVIEIAHRDSHAILLDEYLKTRCMELAVHIEDLALSLDLPHQAPPTTVNAAIEVLVAAARTRHGDAAVLRGLARRERDTVDALRVY